jgi:hypothetical protein
MGYSKGSTVSLWTGGASAVFAMISYILMWLGDTLGYDGLMVALGLSAVRGRRLHLSLPNYMYSWQSR